MSCTAKEKCRSGPGPLTVLHHHSRVVPSTVGHLLSLCLVALTSLTGAGQLLCRVLRNFHLSDASSRLDSDDAFGQECGSSDAVSSKCVWSGPNRFVPWPALFPFVMCKHLTGRCFQIMYVSHLTSIHESYLTHHDYSDGLAKKFFIPRIKWMRRSDLVLT